MTQKHTPDGIRKAVDRFTEAMVGKDSGALTDCFADDCEIEFLHVKLKGKQGAKDWCKWLYGHLTELSFEPKISVINDNVIIEEYVLSGRLHNGSRIKSRQTEVIVFDEEYKIRNFRFYFDRLDFIESGVNRFMAKQIVNTFNQKTLLNLKSH